MRFKGKDITADKVVRYYRWFLRYQLSKFQESSLEIRRHYRDYFVRVGYALRSAGAKVDRLGKPDCTVNFFPEAPDYNYVIRKICYLMGARCVNHPFQNNSETTIYWLDDTWRPPINAENVLNSKCLDISKSTLEKVHQAVFGYSPGVDPTTYAGRMVIKSIVNARHDGCIVQGPIANPSRDCVYQKLIRNDKNGMVEDMRVPIVKGRIPFVYIKHRPIESQFSSINSDASIRNVSEVLNPDEAQRIRALATAMGLELGEIDVLRDAESGRLYVIDVNNTPYGPTNHIDPWSYTKAIMLYTAAFVELVEERRNVRTSSECFKKSLQ